MSSYMDALSPWLSAIAMAVLPTIATALFAWGLQTLRGRKMNTEYYEAVGRAGADAYREFILAGGKITNRADLMKAGMIGGQYLLKYVPQAYISKNLSPQAAGEIAQAEMMKLMASDPTLNTGQSKLIVLTTPFSNDAVANGPVGLTGTAVLKEIRDRTGSLAIALALGGSLILGACAAAPAPLVAQALYDTYQIASVAAANYIARNAANQANQEETERLDGIVKAALAEYEAAPDDPAKRRGLANATNALLAYVLRVQA